MGAEIQHMKTHLSDCWTLHSLSIPSSATSAPLPPAGSCSLMGGLVGALLSVLLWIIGLMMLPQCECYIEAESWILATPLQAPSEL